MKKHRQDAPAERFISDIDTGLSDAQIAFRISEKRINKTKNHASKSYFRIIIDNIFTFFNLIWAILFAINLFLYFEGVATVSHLFFISIILSNTVLAIIQEISAKRQVAKLSLMVAPRVEVVRNGKHIFLSAEELVLDDVIVLSIGNQVPADAVLLTGKVEMNESLLTGESDSIKKQPGDLLLSGSFLVSGSCYARIDKVGADCYIQKLAVAAKTYKSPKSALFNDINRFLRVIGILILPFAALMFWNNYNAIPYIDGEMRVFMALLPTTGSVQGMIPAGMFLLITVALSIGVMRLAEKNTLVKDIYSVEMLSRTNVLCLDKTGTITDGTMRVTRDFIITEGHDVAVAVSGIMSAQTSGNFTSDALSRHYISDRLARPLYNIPFSSKRKFTATTLENMGTYAIGAPEFLPLSPLSASVRVEMENAMKDGYRVLMLAFSPLPLETDELPPMIPIALVILEDHIREEAYDTIRWFKENRVSVRVISGDNPIAVAAIAKRVGIENAEQCISLDGFSDEDVKNAALRYTVFGRVTPEQKHLLIKTLKENGNTVAMTGDGVNDTLALKEADCSIAMAEGSEAARSLSNIVLRDNNFANLPSVVREGRKVVNNVERSSSLYLMKTFAVIVLSVFCVIFRIAYPFETNMLTMLEVFVTGLTSLILALEPNDTLIEGSFLRQVIKRCVPDGFLMWLGTVVVVLAQTLFLPFSTLEYKSCITLVLVLGGLVNLVFLCLPPNKFRIATLLLSLTGLSVCTFVFGRYFGVPILNFRVVSCLIVITAVMIPLHIGLYHTWDRLCRICPPTWKKVCARIESARQALMRRFTR